MLTRKFLFPTERLNRKLNLATVLPGSALARFSRLTPGGARLPTRQMRCESDTGEVSGLVTHYETLGVDCDASIDEIQRAWRVRLLLLHPDRHEGAPAEVVAEA